MKMRFFVATPTAFFREAWVFGCQEKCPRFAATVVANTLTVATPAIFICCGELEKIMGYSLLFVVLPLK
jgi:hypothetical protein